MIEHLRGREQALETARLGPARTRSGSRWFAFTAASSRGAQFCQYFDTDSKRAHRFVKSLLDRRAAHDGEWADLERRSEDVSAYRARRSTGR